MAQKDRANTGTAVEPVKTDWSSGHLGTLRAAGAAPLSFLPGPVAIGSSVRAAFHAPPRSHRAPEFLLELAAARETLQQLVKARHCAVLLGSGTLANDVIAGQLSLRCGPGLILSNGEFGERLLRHAAGFNLTAQVLRCPWGDPFPARCVEEALDRSPGIRWVWGVSCETSTGMLNDTASWRDACRERGVTLCLDCISAIGCLPVDLSGVELASGVSGKGLGAYPGLSLVFHTRPAMPQPDRLPAYLDLGSWAVGGVPFTHSSNLVGALSAALARFGSDQPFGRLRGQAARLRRGLRTMGLRVLLPDEVSSPAVTTLVLPADVSSVEVGDALARAGFLISYRSEYLVSRNWIQVCLMSEISTAAIDSLLAALVRLV